MHGRQLQIILSACLLVAALVTLYVTQRQRIARVTGSRNTGDIATETFTDWAALVASGEWANSQRRKVIFIGIDGASWDIIDPMINEGVLPTFARLKDKGTYGVLTSVDCYVSPPAWTTMMTGFLPSQTGIYTFGQWKRDAREFIPVSSDDVKVPAIWDISSLAGRRTAVTNMPLTYPARPVNGIMVTGLMTPVTLANRRSARLAFREARSDVEPGVPSSYSPVLTATYDHGTSRLLLFLVDTLDDGASLYDRVHLTVFPLRNPAKGRVQLASHEFAVGDHSPWLNVGHLAGGEYKKGWCKVRLMPTRESESHYFLWCSLTLSSIGESDSLSTYPPALAGEIARDIGPYFPSVFVDREMVPAFTKDAAAAASFFYHRDDWDLFVYVFTQTDNIQHTDGASPITRGVYRTIDEYLGELLETIPNNATLVLASDHGFQPFSHSLDLNRFFEMSGLLEYRADGAIDHDRTLAFHNLWCVYFNSDLLNREELVERGIDVPSGVSAAEALRRFIEKAGRSLMTDAGDRTPVEFTRLPGGTAGTAPDLMVKGSYDGYMVEFWNLDKPQDTVIRPLRPDEQWNHTRDGMYLVYGAGVRRGFEGPRYDIQDIAPTLLYLLGLPAGAKMDGEIMARVLDPGLLTETTRYVLEEYDQLRGEPTAVDRDRESLEKRLRSLGYIR